MVFYSQQMETKQDSISIGISAKVSKKVTFTKNNSFFSGKARIKNSKKFKSNGRNEHFELTS